MNKTLMIISAGIEAVPGIKKARDMGLHVVVSDRNPEAPGFALAHDMILADTYGIDQTVSAAVDYHYTVRPIDGVMCMAADVPMTVASVAHELGLPGIPMETARLAADKLAMKICFLEKGIPIPWFESVESESHLRALVRERGWDLILKPVDSRGARGVLKLDSEVNLSWAYRHATAYSPSGRVMVEEYLPGPQVSTESVILPEKAYTPGFADRNYEFIHRFKPYMIENGGEQPSALSEEDQEQVKETAVAAARAMGINRGIAKGDMVLTKIGPAVIEIAARLSGGWFATDQIPLATGVDLIEAAIHLALGEPLDENLLVPKRRDGVAIRYFFPSHGPVKEIHLDPAIEHAPWIHKLQFFVQPGEVVQPVTNHTQRAGFVITTGKDRAEAVTRAEAVVQGVHIVTESEQGVTPKAEAR